MKDVTYPPILKTFWFILLPGRYVVSYLTAVYK